MKAISAMSPKQMKELIDVALGNAKADLVVVGGDLVNVYTGELLPDYSVATKGERIAFVGKNAEHTIGTNTTVIEAKGKTLIPGFIDAHTHLMVYCTMDEFLNYVMIGGTTTIITEILELSFPLGYRGLWQFLETIKEQPIKIFVTAPSMVSLSPAAQANAFSPQTIRKLLKQGGVAGLGETYWPPILQGDDRLLELFAETVALGRKVEGHSAGARGNKLVAYVASGVSSCHESINVDEVLERLRLGLWVMVREGDVRQDLEAIAKIKDEKIDFRRLCLVTDGLSPKQLKECGCMEFIVQKAIDLGFDPIIAIQMATINPAEHFSLDSILGGIAPGRYADIVVIPNLRTIRAELVISNGKVIAKNGQLLVPPKKYPFPASARRSIRIHRRFEPADFNIPVKGEAPVTVRIIELVTDLVTREAQVTITPSQGWLEGDVSRDILKVAVVATAGQPGKMFVSFIKGFRLKKGAIATSGAWDMAGIVVVGTNNEDIALAVNRIVELQGGTVLCADGEILAELPMSIGGQISELSIEEVSQRMEKIQQKATELGVPSSRVYLTLSTLTTAAIPFLRICESGLIDIRESKIVDLIVRG